MSKIRLFSRTVTAWLLILSLIAGLPALSRGEELIGSEEELLAVLARCRAQRTAEFTVTMTGGYFSRIIVDNPQEFAAVRLKAGISSASMGYSTETRTLHFKNVEWTEPHAAEASTEQEFRNAVRDFMGQGIYDFQIIVRDERLFESLHNKGRAYQYAAMYGADTLRVRVTDVSPYVFYLDEFEQFRVPWSSVSSPEDWVRAVESMAERNATTFTLVVDPFFAEKLQRDTSLVDKIKARCPMSEWKSSYRADYSRFEFTDVVFSSDPRIECETEEAVTEAIRQMGASGVSGFTLILSGDLYDAISASDFKRLRELEGDAGMSDRELTYSPTLHTLAYANAVIHSNAARLATVQEATARLEEAVAAGEEHITLFCTPELYNLLVGGLSGQTGGGENPGVLGDGLVHAGVFDYTYTYSRASHIIKIDISALYPGTKIMLAVRRGEEGSLAPREAETLAAARQLAQECRSRDPLATARKIHDALCVRIVYTTDESTDEDDTAVGALLNGQANCDGYSDAFYLAGSLAGLEVRYQHGDSREKDTDEKNRDASHLWNLIRIDGTWRLVDVTWDDQDYGIIYTWFNIGADRARRSHTWNEEISVPLAEKTESDERPEAEYQVRDPAGAETAAADAAEKGTSPFILVFPEGSAVNEEEVLEVLRRNLRSSFTWEWNNTMRIMRVETKP